MQLFLKIEGCGDGRDSSPRNFRLFWRPSERSGQAASLPEGRASAMRLNMPAEYRNVSGNGRDHFVAVSSYSEELKNVGTGFRRIYPLPADDDFDDLLHAIDRTSSKGIWRR